MNSYYPAIAQRANYRCEYCHAPELVFNFPFEVEHIIPLFRQGTNEDQNLALAIFVKELASRVMPLTQILKLASFTQDKISGVNIFRLIPNLQQLWELLRSEK
jgi:HNH endonuclease